MSKTVAKHGFPITPGLVNALINGKCVKFPQEDGEFESPTFDQLKDSSWLTRAILQELYSSLGINPDDHAGDPLNGAAIAAFIRSLGANPTERAHYVSVLRGFVDHFNGDPVSGMDGIGDASKLYADNLAVSIRSEVAGVSQIASAAYQFLQSHIHSTGDGELITSLPAHDHPVFSMDIPYGSWIIDGSLRFYVPSPGALTNVTVGLMLDGSIVGHYLYAPDVPANEAGHVTFPRHLVMQSYPSVKQLSIVVSMSGTPGTGIVTAGHLFATKVPQG